MPDNQSESLCKGNEVSQSDGTQFSRFHSKRALSNGEAVCDPWLIYSAWKNIIFCSLEVLGAVTHGLLGITARRGSLCW